MAAQAPAVPRPEPEREDVELPDDIRLTQEDLDLGRHARRPSDIPARGWWAVIRRVMNEATGDQISMVAASCGFYSLLALFPAISVLISIYGLVLDPLTVERQLEAVRDVLPPTTYDLIAQRVHDLAAAGSTKLSWGLVVGMLIALWSAMAGTKAMLTALNVAYEETEKRSFLRFNLESFLFTLGGLFGVLLALTIIVGLPAVLNLVLWWLGPLTAVAIRVASFLLLLAFVMLALAVLYRYGPSRAEAEWHWVTPGSFLAALLWFAASLLFSFYVSNFGSYDAAYGSLGAVIVALMWFYISAFAVMLGAELNAELELQTRRDTTTGPIKPMGERGAFVADHVATTS